MSVTWLFKIDWTNDGDFGDAGEDVSAYVLEGSYQRGRDYASNLTGKCSAGTCALTLLNTDGRFSPFKADGPLYGKLLPRRKIQISTYNTVGPATAIQWTGFIDSITPTADLSGRHTVEITGVGPLAVISDRTVTVALQTGENTGTLIGLILTAAGWPAGDRSLDVGKTVVPYYWCDNKNALEAIRELEESEKGFVYETKDGKIAFENRLHRYSGTHLVSQATFTDDTAPGAGELGYQSIGHEDLLGEVYNIASATTTQYSAGTLADLWQLADSGSLSPAIAADETLTFWAEPPSSSAELVLTWTTPAATTDYTANSLPTGNGTNATADMSIVATKFARSMKIEITNGGASTAYITLLKARGIPLVAGDPTSVESQDATSITAYGERTYPIEAPWLSDTTIASKYCDAIVVDFKNPRPVVSMEYLAIDSADHVAEMIARDIGDRVTVDADDSAMLGFDDEFYVETISVSLANSFEWNVAYNLAPCPTLAADMWQLGTSELGTETVLVDAW